MMPYNKRHPDKQMTYDIVDDKIIIYSALGNPVIKSLSFNHIINKYIIKHKIKRRKPIEQVNAGHSENVN